VPLVAQPWSWSGTAKYNTNISEWQNIQMNQAIQTEAVIPNPAYPQWGSFASDCCWSSN